ncbi:hypothetical protein HBIAX_03488 [Achromobacter xylosoxidans]|uniref:Uncharacterized protein n=1 Tax=Bordetella ansorpii TaxID=288768 RepID=A0A157SAS6_9BORD|nr:hypothetical protein HBIAX_03488 [Achromobacter xylosoxidans]SAI67522.1 Uncharacterised protein [Bordetella ansorpii]
MNLLGCKSAPIASLVIPIRRRPGAAHPLGRERKWTTGGHGDFASRGMRAAQGKIVVTAGCAESARGGPAMCAGPPCRSQDSHNKAAMGRNCGRCLHGGYGQRHDDTAVRRAMAWPCPVFRPKSAAWRRCYLVGAIAAAWCKTANRPQLCVPMRRSRHAHAPASSTNGRRATGLVALWRSVGPHARLAGRAHIVHALRAIGRHWAKQNGVPCMSIVSRQLDRLASRMQKRRI